MPPRTRASSLPASRIYHELYRSAQSPPLVLVHGAATVKSINANVQEVNIDDGAHAMHSSHPRHVAEAVTRFALSSANL